MVFADVTYTTHAGKWCSNVSQSSGNLDKSKESCAGRSDCAGVTVYGGQCFFLGESCKDDFTTLYGSTVYLKTDN